MKKIEDEYYVIVYDFSNPNRLDYIGDNPDHVRRLSTDTQIQPLRYLIDKDSWLKGKAPADISKIVYGLLINDKIKQDLYIKLTDANIMIHPSYAVSPDDDYFEGYWLIAIPAAPLSWINIKESDIRYLDDEGPDADIISNIDKYVFSLEFIALPLKDRLYFEIDFGYYTPPIIHKSLVEYFAKYSNRDVKFIQLTKFISGMKNHGPLPEFAI